MVNSAAPQQRRAWKRFTERYDIVFNYEDGEFYDIFEWSMLINELRMDDDPKVRRFGAEAAEALGW